MNQAALLGGLFIGVLSALPIVSVANCCCLWYVGGGVLAAYLQYQTTPVTALTAAEGARAGLLAGVVGAFVWLLATVVLQAIIAPFQEQLLERVLRNAETMPPESRAWLEAMAASANAPLQRAIGFAFQFLAGTLFGAIGGMLGAAFFRRDLPPALGGPAIPPPS